MTRVIYLICRVCDDSYYDGHPTDDAFTTRSAAEAKLIELNGPEDTNEFPYVPQFYIHATNLHSA